MSINIRERCCVLRFQAANEVLAKQTLDSYNRQAYCGDGKEPFSSLACYGPEQEA